MKTGEQSTTPTDTPSGTAPNNEATGLPGLHTWRGVYIFVFGSFVLWVVLLFALTRIFS